jgi:hypothetical protein
MVLDMMIWWIWWYDMDMNGSNCLKNHGSFRRMPWDAMPVVGHLRWAVEQLSHPMPAVPGQRWTAETDSGNGSAAAAAFGSCGSARGTWSLQHNYFSQPGHAGWWQIRGNSVPQPFWSFCRFWSWFTGVFHEFSVWWTANLVPPHWWHCLAISWNNDNSTAPKCSQTIQLSCDSVVSCLMLSHSFSKFEGKLRTFELWSTLRILRTLRSPRLGPCRRFQGGSVGRPWTRSCKPSCTPKIPIRTTKIMWNHWNPWDSMGPLDEGCNYPLFYKCLSCFCWPFIGFWSVFVMHLKFKCCAL